MRKPRLRFGTRITVWRQEIGLEIFGQHGTGYPRLLGHIDLSRGRNKTYTIHDYAANTSVPVPAKDAAREASRRLERAVHRWADMCGAPPIVTEAARNYASEAAPRLEQALRSLLEN